MDWNTLKILALISEHGSMTAAAKALGVNYTTVFRRIEALERDLGGKLFERGLTRYSPTPLAEETLILANSMLEASQQIERNIIGKEFQPKGLVKITAPFNIANRILPIALRDVRAKYPNIHFQVFSSNDALNLNSREADIAVRATSSPPEHLIGRKVNTIPWGMFASKDFIESFLASSSIESLTNYPLIGGAGSMMNLPAFSWLEKHHSDSIVIRCDELTAMSYFAEEGLGIAFLPLDQKRKGLTQVAAFPHGKESDIWILTHPDHRKTKRINLVVDSLVQYFNEIDFSC